MKGHPQSQKVEFDILYIMVSVLVLVRKSGTTVYQNMRRVQGVKIVKMKNCEIHSSTTRKLSSASATAI